MASPNALDAYVKVASTKSKSVNVEHSNLETANEKYVLTGRALETIERICESLENAEAGRSFAITGPYGSGKSSFVLFLKQLLTTRSKTNKAQKQLLEVNPELAQRLTSVLRKGSIDPEGFVVGMATAQREPVRATVRKVLENASSSNPTVISKSLQKTLVDENVSSDQLLTIVQEILKKRALLLVIDEFGKNLESFKEKPADSDLFILQQLAEIAQSETAFPLVFITLKHLAFNEYSNDLDQTPRRELAKVQGRFEEVMFVEDPAETRKLVAALFSSSNVQFDKATTTWQKEHEQALAGSGLSEILDKQIVKKVLPLHPMNLACLPELCSRFAQNDRTLFAYLGSNDPRSVYSFIANQKWTPKDPLPLLRLDHLYDYFVESVSTSISTSDLSSRWIEIETRIRDTAGLTDSQVRVLKTIGVLNLISAGGIYRASRNAISFAISDAIYGSPESAEIVEAIEGNPKKKLKGLIELGVVVYREFADEFRIWLGTDYPIQEKMQIHRFDAKQKGIADLLNLANPLSPMVASRHSQKKGILRIFERKFIANEELVQSSVELTESTDGNLFFLVDAYDKTRNKLSATGQPVVLATASKIDEVYETAIEVFALKEVARDAEATNADRTARREIAERLGLVQTKLMALVEASWAGPGSEYYEVSGDKSSKKSGENISQLLSDVCDDFYKDCPVVRNEMIARREVTGQGARARRLLSEAMITHTDFECFDIEGFGPERAMYDAIFKDSGFHKKFKDSKFELMIPKLATETNKWPLVLGKIESLFEESTSSRLSLGDACKTLELPPYGLKMGIIPLLLLAEIVRQKRDILVYEHGSLVTEVDDAIAERLIKNPNHFSVKVLQQSKNSIELLHEYSEALFAGRTPAPSSVVGIGKQIYSEVRSLNRYPMATSDGLSDEAKKIRSCIKEATELDVLILEMMPKAVGCKPIVLGKKSAEASKTIAKVAEHFNGLIGAYGSMLQRAQSVISTELGLKENASVALIQKNTEKRAEPIRDGAFEPNLKALAGALLRRNITEPEWVEHVAMVLAGGKVPHGWDDDQFNLFSLAAKNFLGRFLRLSELAGASGFNDEDGTESVLVSVTANNGAELRERYFLSREESRLRKDLVRGAIEKLQESGLSQNDASAALIAELVGTWRNKND
jgi:energy-coupling factor transporter ATP-binding protein EcfA2